MAIMKEYVFSHNVKDTTGATPQIITTALPRDVIIKQVTYRYRVGTMGPAAFQLMQLADGENVTPGRPYYLVLGAPLQNFASWWRTVIPTANKVVTIPERYQAGGLNGATYSHPLWRLGKSLPAGYSIGIYFSGNLAGLKDLDITMTLLPVQQVIPVGP